MVDPELVDILVKAVGESMSTAARPVEGTKLGNVLGPAYAERGLQTGPGAYKPVMDEAVAQGRLRKVWDSRTRMGLIPVPGDPPAGWSDRPHPGQRADERVMADGGPRSSTGGDSGEDPAALRQDVYDAFTGIRGSASLDLARPPWIRVGGAGQYAIAVEPVPLAQVAEAWRNFAAEQGLEEAARVSVEGTLITPVAAWSWLTVPGDSPHRRLGSKFHRVRLHLLGAHIRRFFESQGKEASNYELGRPPRSGPATIQPTAGRTATALRERLKRVIDRMSLEQLLELRIPAEFLE